MARASKKTVDQRPLAGEPGRLEEAKNEIDYGDCFGPHAIAG